MTATVSEELKYCQGLIQEPLLEKLVAIRGALAGAATNAEALRPLMASARFACRIFYSLNSLGLTEVRPARGNIPLFFEMSPIIYGVFCGDTDPRHLQASADYVRVCRSKHLLAGTLR